MRSREDRDAERRREHVCTAPHISDEFEEKDGWWEPTCACGATLGVFPDVETAADALMEHAYEQGILDERHGHVPR